MSKSLIRIVDTGVIKKVTREVAGLRQQLFAWGRRTKPKLNYILMRNMGVPLSKTKLNPTKDAEIITKKKTEALQRFEVELHLNIGKCSLISNWYCDPNSNYNCLRYIKEDPNLCLVLSLVSPVDISVLYFACSITLIIYRFSYQKKKEEEDPNMDAHFTDWAGAEKIGPNTNNFAQAGRKGYLWSHEIAV